MQSWVAIMPLPDRRPASRGRAKGNSLRWAPAVVYSQRTMAASK